MTTVDDIRKRHDPLCSGWCDVAVLLRTLENRQRRNDQLEAALAQRNETIRSMRQQIKYLAGRLNDQAGPDTRRLHETIDKLRASLAVERERYDRQVAATRRRRTAARRAEHQRQAIARVNVQLRAALLRAGDELEALIGEPQQWIADALAPSQVSPWTLPCGQSVPVAIRLLSVNLAFALRQDEPAMLRHYAGETCRQLDALAGEMKRLGG